MRTTNNFLVVLRIIFNTSVENRPIRLTQCCTQFKSPWVKILCVLYFHYNVAFTFKWYGNIWNKTFYSQRVWIGYNIASAELVYYFFIVLIIIFRCIASLFLGLQCFAGLAVKADWFESLTSLGDHFENFEVEECFQRECQGEKLSGKETKGVFIFLTKSVRSSSLCVRDEVFWTEDLHSMKMEIYAELKFA